MIDLFIKKLGIFVMNVDVLVAAESNSTVQPERQLKQS